MTRDLLIVSERALTVSDLTASVAAVHQGQRWAVTDDGDQLAITHCDQPLLRLAASERLEDGGRPSWRTRLTLIDEQATLGLEVARAMAWEAGGNLLADGGDLVELSRPSDAVGG